MTLQDKLEAGTSRCEKCNQVTDKILVDDGGECMAFCSWQCRGSLPGSGITPTVNLKLTSPSCLIRVMFAHMMASPSARSGTAEYARKLRYNRLFPQDLLIPQHRLCGCFFPHYSQFSPLDSGLHDALEEPGITVEYPHGFTALYATVTTCRL